MAEIPQKPFWQRRTVWTSLFLMVTPFLTALGDAIGMTIEPTTVEGIQMVVLGAALIFARTAIENSK